MAKINLTKGHLTKLEAVNKALQTRMKYAKGAEKKELKDLSLTVQDILIRHENRKEKEY